MLHLPYPTQPSLPGDAPLGWSLSIASKFPIQSSPDFTRPTREIILPRITFSLLYPSSRSHLTNKRVGR